MNAIDRDVVAAISHEIAAELGEVRYDLWFRDNAKLHLDDQELLVGVPNLFFQEWLSNNFLPTLRRAAERFEEGHDALSLPTVQIQIRVA